MLCYALRHRYADPRYPPLLIGIILQLASLWGQGKGVEIDTNKLPHIIYVQGVPQLTHTGTVLTVAIT